MLLYFVEKTIAPLDLDARDNSAKRAEILREFGLDAIAGDARAILRPGLNGPSGNAGTVLAFTETDTPGSEQIKVGYYADKQEWVKCASGKYWCGKVKGEPVDPKTLRRPDALSGHWVKLSDGQQWEVARARYYDGRQSLTCSLELNAAGQVVRGNVIDRYAELDKAAHVFFIEWLEAIERGVYPEAVYSDLVRLAVLGLSANYRLGIDEAVSLLKLFHEENVWDACLATISWPTVLAMSASDDDAQKKTDAAAIPIG